MKILIFSGTSDGRRLSRRLAESDAEVTVCVATEYGSEEQGSSPGVAVLTGRRTAEEMAALLPGFALCIDATHPYAVLVSENIRAACEKTGVPYRRLLRGACEAEGADGLTITNTLLGMVIDPRRGKPIVSTKMAGFSGPAIMPVSLRMVYQAYEAVKIPIIGAGGIRTADDVICYLSAGASAVQVGAHNLVDPMACKKIIDDLPKKMAEYKIDSLQSIIGRAHG